MLSEVQGAPNRVHCESWFRVWFLQDTGETKTTSGYQRTKWLPCRKVTIIYQFTGFCVILAANEISHCMQMVKRYRDPLPAHKKQDLKKKFKTKIRKPKTWITRLCSLTCQKLFPSQLLQRHRHQVDGPFGLRVSRDTIHSSHPLDPHGFPWRFLRLLESTITFT